MNVVAGGEQHLSEGGHALQELGGSQGRGRDEQKCRSSVGHLDAFAGEVFLPLRLHSHHLTLQLAPRLDSLHTIRCMAGNSQGAAVQISLMHLRWSSIIGS